jgi:protein-disulfide isomerase
MTLKWMTLTLLMLAGSALAQIGEPPERFVQALAVYDLEEAAEGFSADGVTFGLETRGGVTYLVRGEGPLDEAGRALIAQVLGVATGYGEGITEPIREFLQARAGELAGRGPVNLTVEEYLLELEVTGDAPHHAVFSLALQEAPEAMFPHARHATGPQDATVVIREFSDFQCPYCAQYALETLPEVKAGLLERGDVRFEYHHFPLDSIHPNARPAAEAAECVVAANANEPESFWVFHDALFERTQAWQGLSDPGAYFVRLAQDLGLSADGVEACIEAREFGPVVQDSFQAAVDLGLRGTPTVFINGYRMRNPFDLAEYGEKLELIEAFRE